MDSPFLSRALAGFEQRLPTVARIYRRSDGVEAETTATIRIGSRQQGRLLDIRAEGGELPAFSLDTVEGSVFISDRDQDAASLIGEDQAVLRVFALLDPRFVAESFERWRGFPQGPYFRILGYVRLDHLPVDLPEAYLDFLKDAPLRGWADWAWEGLERFQPEHPLDHPIALLFTRGGDRLVEVRQPDLYPRRADLIIERFDRA